jgi:hypothetical protein
MNYWIFKVSSQSIFPDAPGRTYAYDNTHSRRLAARDEFLYLEKLGTRYGLTGAGCVSRVTQRRAIGKERRSDRIDRIFTAHLTDVMWFSSPLDLSAQTKTGRSNRQVVGLPGDLNSIGWSISMPRIERELFVRLLDAALDATIQGQVLNSDDEADWCVDDSWSLVRRRRRTQKFRAAVLARHNHTCAVCGTRAAFVLDAAHVRSYAAHPAQRANPANGICLCSFCHAAFDSGAVLILPDGSLRTGPDLTDEIACLHFTAVPAEKRRNWLRGVDKEFLRERASANLSLKRT